MQLNQYDSFSLVTILYKTVLCYLILLFLLVICKSFYLNLTGWILVNSLKDKSSQANCAGFSNFVVTISMSDPTSVKALLFRRKHRLEDFPPSGSGSFPFLGDSLGSSSLTSKEFYNIIKRIHCTCCCNY